MAIELTTLLKRLFQWVRLRTHCRLYFYIPIKLYFYKTIFLYSYISIFLYFYSINYISIFLYFWRFILIFVCGLKFANTLSPIFLYSYISIFLSWRNISFEEIFPKKSHGIFLSHSFSQNSPCFQGCQAIDWNFLTKWPEFSYLVEKN